MRYSILCIEKKLRRSTYGRIKSGKERNMWSFFWASLYQLMDEIVMFLLFLPVTVMVLIILFQFGSDLLHYFRSYWHGSSL